MKEIVVIGGGISGLAAAHRLLERRRELEEPLRVTLLEAGSRPGGIIQTEERDGFLLERGPDAFISEKPEALNLARQLNLESRLIETNSNHRRSFLVKGEQLVPVPEGFHLLAPGRLRSFFGSSILSWRGKARVAMDLLIPRANGDQEETLAQFVTRRLGREALDRIAQPMVGGIYTADPEALSLNATMPRFQQMEQKHRSLILALRRQNRNVAAEGTSGARYSLFLTFDRGMQVLTDALSERISNDEGGSIRLSTTVVSLDLARDSGTSRWRIETNSGETFFADGVCLALPGNAGANLVRNINPQLAAELAAIRAASSLTINFAYKRAAIAHPLDGFGFVVPFIEKKSIMACTFSSVKFHGRAPEDCALLRVFAGGALQPELLNLSHSELIARVTSELRSLLGIRGAPLFTEISRWHDAMPQYEIGHLDRVKRIRELSGATPSFALAGNAFNGPGIPDCIRSGEDAADQLLEG